MGVQIQKMDDVIVLLSDEEVELLRVNRFLNFYSADSVYTRLETVESMRDGKPKYIMVVVSEKPKEMACALVATMYAMGLYVYVGNSHYFDVVDAIKKVVD